MSSHGTRVESVHQLTVTGRAQSSCQRSQVVTRGYWLDRDKGLYLCQARWYDPVTGRWVTRDPIGYAGGANLYGYCGGGPIGWADPSGLILPAVIAGAALVLAAWDVYDLITEPDDPLSWIALIDPTPVSNLAKFARRGAKAAKAIESADQAGEATVKLYKGTKLARNMAKAGKPVTKGAGVAHHIVAKGARGAEEARDVLKKYGIDIDDPCNGLALPKDYHQRMHTTNYYQKVNDKLSKASSAAHARDLLTELANEILKDARKRP